MALPLVLPPTVLGFYLLILMAPDGVVGRMTLALDIGTLPFTFEGLVVASMLYSRITSYNVCYTKLLRDFHRRLADRFKGVSNRVYHKRQ